MPDSFDEHPERRALNSVVSQKNKVLLFHKKNTPNKCPACCLECIRQVPFKTTFLQPKYFGIPLDCCGSEGTGHPALVPRRDDQEFRA